MAELAENVDYLTADLRDFHVRDLPSLGNPIVWLLLARGIFSSPLVILFRADPFPFQRHSYPNPQPTGFTRTYSDSIIKYRALGIHSRREIFRLQNFLWRLVVQPYTISVRCCPML